VATAADQAFRYLRPSRVSGSDLTLSTSGGTTAHGPAAHPVFFDGHLPHAQQFAAALLVVAKVARSRFWTPPNMVAAAIRAADPVVTGNRDRLRFESFSACCGVHARLDVLPEALDGTLSESGTTNVDFNQPMRNALAGIGGTDPLHLRVGVDVEVTTRQSSIVERKVPLPERWLKGFAEVQLATARMEPSFEVSPAAARRFVRELPRTSSPRGSLYAAPVANGLRLTTRQDHGAVPVAGPERLRVLEPLLPFATSLRAYCAPGSGAGAWELTLRDARVVVTLSPEVMRGFSGEGGILWDLADDIATEDADLIGALLVYDPTIDVEAMAAHAALPPDRVRTALGRLGAAGRVGWDCAENAYFHRELPYDPALLTSLHPRLRDARALVESKSVRIDGDVAFVASGGVEHEVRRGSDGDRCTCPWFGRHRGTRGPCKHVLAAELQSRSATLDDDSDST
jgi:hypothetical protein